MQAVFEANDEFSVGIAKAKLDAMGIDSTVAGRGPYRSVEPGAYRLLVEHNNVDVAMGALADVEGAPIQPRHSLRLRVATWCFIAAAVGVPVLVRIIQWASG